PSTVTKAADRSQQKFRNIMAMECLACHAQNDPADDRCARCGRRLHLADARPAPAGWVSQSGAATAVAPTLETCQGVRVTAYEEVADSQPSLFRDVLSGAKVIPIPTLTPMRVPGERPSQYAPRRSAPRRPPVRTVRKPNDFQQRLDLHGAAEPVA